MLAWGRRRFMHQRRADLESQGDNYILPVWKLVLAKDYVTGLTDDGAYQEHRKHIGHTEYRLQYDSLIGNGKLSGGGQEFTQQRLC